MSIGQGIHELDAAEYHADPCETPSLSASTARILIAQSPAHARAAHPRLNPDYRRVDDGKLDVGTAAHALFLEGRDAVIGFEYPDWRTKAAQAARDAARADGKIPLLGHQWDDVQEMCGAIRGQLDAVDDTLFRYGDPERTLIWREDDIWCRARLDWLFAGGGEIHDLKTTSKSASPHTWSRTLFGNGSDIQAAFYLRGVKAILGVDAQFRWAVVETHPPYALAVFALAPDALAVADAKVDYAIRTWRDCIQKDEWPAYPTRVCHVQLPPWEEARWLEREAIEEAA